MMHPSVLAKTGAGELAQGTWDLRSLRFRGLGVSGLGFGVWGFGFGVWGLGFRVQQLPIEQYCSKGVIW